MTSLMLLAKFSGAALAVNKKHAEARERERKRESTSRKAGR